MRKIKFKSIKKVENLEAVLDKILAEGDVKCNEILAEANLLQTELVSKAKAQAAEIRA